jgi:hypothetical protein
MARYAWKTSGADGTEATGTFAFTSLNMLTLQGTVDVDGKLVVDDRGGYGGGFGRDRITVGPSGEAGAEVALEVECGAKLSIDAGANRMSIRTLNRPVGTPFVFTEDGVDYLRLALNRAIENLEPGEITASLSQDASERA